MAVSEAVCRLSGEFVIILRDDVVPRNFGSLFYVYVSMYDIYKCVWLVPYKIYGCPVVVSDGGGGM